jgi:hypothetical protein
MKRSCDVHVVAGDLFSFYVSVFHSTWYISCKLLIHHYWEAGYCRIHFEVFHAFSFLIAFVNALSIYSCEMKDCVVDRFSEDKKRDSFVAFSWGGHVYLFVASYVSSSSLINGFRLNLVLEISTQRWANFILILVSLLTIITFKPQNSILRT